jgi:hypothetical protein
MKMTEQRKLCKNCLYYEKSWLGHLFRSNSLDRCYNPIITGDLVTGDKKSEYCKVARDFEMHCGRDGRYFEQLWGDKK